MKRTLLAALIVATSAWAGETLLGVILVTDAGTVSNATTGYASAGCASQTSPGGAGACAQAFPIGAPMLLSIQCKDQGAKIAVNKATTDAGEGVTVAADQFFTTATAVTKITITGLPDGGTYTGGVVSIAPLAGAARAECNVWSRQGSE